VSGTARTNGRYRVLALDIDNTLVRFPDPVSPRVYRAVRAAVDAGVRVLLVTGRAYRRALPVARELDLTTPLICNHGGVIRDGVDGTIMKRTILDHALTSEIVAWLKSQPIGVILFDGDHVYRDCTAERIVPDFHIYTRGPQSHYVPDLLAHIPAETEVLMATEIEEAFVAQVAERARLRWTPTIRVMYSHPHSVDLMPHTSKSNALAWMVEQWGVSREEVLAVGDGINDVDFLSWAGTGVALADGHPEALAAADAVAPSFEEDGVAWAVETFLSAKLRC
jgi:Cof subfamily protein (haloacid dehalogenase superfamily)